MLWMGEHGWLDAFLVCVAFVLLFSAIYSANLFLLLACAALWKHPPLIEWLWRWRVVIDVLVVALGWWFTPRVGVG